MSTKTKKLRYSAAHLPAVRETYIKVDSPVSLPVYVKKKRYEASEADGGSEFIKQLMQALAATAEWQYLRKLMAEQPGAGDIGGGELVSEESAPIDPVSDYEAKRRQFHRVGHDGQASLHFSRPKPKPDNPTERYQRRQAAHAEACRAFDALNESRKNVSARAAQYAMSHGHSYNEALRGIGKTRPDVKMIGASVY